ncbi:MAG TPA: FmdB family zinc ribbon protein [Pseudonocardiaceae bacterium]|jgi:putative FmdB family regulatory protein
MAAYDYRCRTCDSVFEVHRPMTAEAGGVRCPGGHDEVTRVWSAVAFATGTAASRAAAPATAAGGCCGGGCCGGG